jgi:rhodanese-related sulfurtransferase
MAIRFVLVLGSAALLSACASQPVARTAPAPDDRVAMESAIDNPAIDMPAFLAQATEAASHRGSRRLTEAQFLAMMADPDTIVLDARSADRYAMLHVKGAVNLPFPDIAVESLARMLPDKGQRILIYCNNNFTGNEVAMATKIAPASLNLSTYVSLYSYGYRNVYELGPQVDLSVSKLPFEGSQAVASR